MTDYYVDGAVGNDGNTGLGEGASLAFATIQRAFDENPTSGDRIYVKNSAVYTEQVTPSTVVATNVNPFIIEGYQDTVGDNGRVIIDAESTRTYAVQYTPAAYYHIWKNFTFQNSTSTAFNGVSSSRIAHYNNVFQNAGQSGCLGGGANTYVNCEVLNCSNTGLGEGASLSIIGCLIQNGGNKGVTALSTSAVYRCVISKNGNSSAEHQLDVTSIQGGFFQNTIVGSGSGETLIRAHNWTQTGSLIDNILIDGGLVLDWSAGRTIPQQVIGYNLLHNNTLDYEYNLTGIHPYDDAPQADPLFVDKAGDDFTLQDSSPALNVGVTPGRIT